MKTIDIEQIKKDIKIWFPDYELLWARSCKDNTIAIGVIGKKIISYIFNTKGFEAIQETNVYFAYRDCQAIKYFYPEDNYLWVNPKYQDFYDNYNNYNDKAEYYEAVFLRACSLKKVTAPSEEEFRLNLSKLEQEALSKIKEKFMDSGNISVVKLIQETNISRPIWTSLMNKMKEHGFAEVESQGVKGTYIKFL